LLCLTPGILKGGHIHLLKPLKLGCSVAFLFVTITASVGGVIVSLLVPGAWRKRTLFADPFALILLIAGLSGLVLGVAVGIWRNRKSNGKN
jgi:O-antigen ligase